MENGEGVAEHAINALNLAMWTLIGAAIGLASALIILVILRVSFRRSKLIARLRRRTRVPMCAALTVLGGWIAFGVVMPPDEAELFSWVSHALLLLLICVTGWYFYRLSNLVQDVAQLRIEKDSRDARRLQTQSQVFRRVVQSIVVLVTAVACILTFPEARAPLATLFASAGLLSVVVGLAAQSSLGNMFAGIQLAVTDAIRVGDTVNVMIGSKQESGVVEEVTLTYVVVRVWDERRILLPSTEFTTKPFENWTRRDSGQLGSVKLDLDWEAPMPRIRRFVQGLLQQSDLWDGRTYSVQMVDGLNGHPLVRIVVSAKNAGDLHDLTCYVREQVIAWIVDEIPWALPRTRMVPEETHEVNKDVSNQKIAKLAEELSGIAGDSAGEEGTEAPTPAKTTDPLHASRVKASQLRAHRQQRQRRRSVLDKAKHDATETSPDATIVMTNPGEWANARLFSGSPEAEERGRIFNGPGEETIREREQTATMQALDAKGHFRSKSSSRSKKGKHDGGKDTEK